MILSWKYLGAEIAAGTSGQDISTPDGRVVKAFDLNPNHVILGWKYPRAGFTTCMGALGYFYAKWPNG